MNNMNIPKEWDSYVTQQNLGLEIIPSVLYDTLTYTDNSTTNLNFFQQTNVALDLSNMVQSGMLPNPEAFLIQAISIFYRIRLTTDDMGASAATAASKLDDIIALSNTGVAQLKIGNKQYGPWPIWRLPASTFVQGNLAAAGGEAANQITEYGQLSGPLYALFPNLMISPLQQFVFSLSWPSGAVDLTGNVAIQVLFDGQRARSIQ